MATSSPTWSVGEIAMRKGRYCEIVKIHYEMEPPSVTVKMLDTDDDVNTEFRKLQKVNPEDMPTELRQKLNLLPEEPWQCSACTLINEDPTATACSLCETPRQFDPPPPPQSQPEIANPDADGDSPMIGGDEQMEENENEEWDLIDNPDNELSVVSWNVWFREDIQIERRIQAILSHITNSQAHVVILQEVTPLILNLIESSEFYTEGGWKTYGSELAEDRELRYFVVILSRIPPSSSNDKPQLIPMTTNMSRYCLAMDFVWKGRDVTVATTHLESREGGFSGTNNKHSAIRRSQIETCFERLSAKKNVVFGGDMNWVDSSSNGDGQLDVPREWTDVWLRLRGNEIGATYDEQSNEMIMGIAQHRLDRLFVKGKEDEREGRLAGRWIELIGTDAIRGLTFEKSVRSGSFHESRHVPVYPSSHYGLAARFGFDPVGR